MKRYLLSLLILLIAFPLYAQDWQEARMTLLPMGPGVASAPAGCGATSEPAGDIFSDGFETATTGYELTKCGSAPCWTESGTVDPAYSITSLSPPTASCNQGLQTGSTGTAAYTTYNKNATASSYFFRFSLRVVSDGLTQFQNTAIACGGSGAACVGSAGTIQIIEYATNSTDPRLRVAAGTNSDPIPLTIGTWYVVDACVPASDETGNFCGTGTNGQGWISIDGGATKKTYTSGSTTAAQYYSFGIITGSRTANIIFGYVAVDDDGTF